jgi:hypothetical protein
MTFVTFSCRMWDSERVSKPTERAAATFMSMHRFSLVSKLDVTPLLSTIVSAVYLCRPQAAVI